MNKSCDTCVSRFICPLKGRPCSGWNDEGLFWGLHKAVAPTVAWDRVAEHVKSLQREVRE